MTVLDDKATDVGEVGDERGRSRRGRTTRAMRAPRRDRPAVAPTDVAGPTGSTIVDDPIEVAPRRGRNDRSPGRADRKQRPGSGNPRKAAQSARERREKHHARMLAEPGLHQMLDKARENARHLPLVLVIVALLVSGLVGVLWLNTLTDQAGIQTNNTKAKSAELQLKVEQLTSDIAYRDATPAIAEQARRLGLVPAGDAAILVLPSGEPDGPVQPTVIGSPTPVAGPAAPPADAPATTPAVATPIPAIEGPGTAPAGATAPATSPAVAQ